MTVEALAAQVAPLAMAAPPRRPTAQWHYLVTDLRTGNTLVEHLPFEVQSFTDSLFDPGSGTFTASVPVTPETVGLNPEAATMPRRSVVWPLRDGQPMGAYLIWARPGYTSGDDVINVQAQRVDSLLTRRLIDADLGFSQVDQLGIARDLIRYALGRPLEDVQTQPAGKGAAFDVPWLRLDPALSGVLRDRLEQDPNSPDQDASAYLGSSRKKIGEALRQLAGLATGFEYRLDYAIDPDTARPYATFRFGYPRLGSSVPAVAFEYPGAVQKYTLDEDGSDSATVVHFVGAGEGESMTTATATDTGAHASGYPPLEVAISDKDVSVQATADEKAEAALSARLGDNEGWTLTVFGDADPVFGSYAIGDHVTLRLSTRRWGLRERTLRIIGWTVRPGTASRRDSVDLLVAPAVS